MPRNNKNWTEEDDRRLMDLVASGMHKSKIAETLDRTEAAVETRASNVRSRMKIDEKS